MATDGEVDWETIARGQLERITTQTGEDLEQAFRVLGGRIERGTADAREIVEARTAIGDAIDVLEYDIAPAVVPEEQSCGSSKYIPNNGVAADFLNVTMDQVNEVTNGAVIELGDAVRQRIAAGHTVQVETQAGIEVTLTAENPDPVQHSVTLFEDDLRRLLEGRRVRHGLGDGQCIELETADIATENTGP